MEKIFIKEIGRIKKAREDVEKALKVKMVFGSEGIEITGKDVVSEYTALRVIEALNQGFNVNSALQLKNEDYMFEKVNLKDRIRVSRLKTIKGRIIGEKGRAKDVMSELTDCDITVKDYIVGIIGKAVDVDVAVHAINELANGAPHSKVYSYLEKSRKIRILKLEEEESLR